ncbi:hypothetical protein [Enterococcus sp. AZ007]|uniref:hypothetical protein n=1 Tax=Enterococcus sp. AZ007 TaxID=2774839 RepID=UPI003F20B29F
MEKLPPTEYLDDKQWSPLWEHFLSQATLFEPSTIHEISCILPLPGRKGVLVFAESNIYFSPTTALKTLYHFSSFHSFSDYHVLASSLKQLGQFGKYKMPWVCPFFTLFPLTKKDKSIWINPLKISKLVDDSENTYAQMSDGLCLLMPIGRRPVLKRAEMACLILATIRRGVFHYILQGETPVDFLYLPATPFAKTLSNRTCLQSFRTAIGQINRLYQITYSLHHCEPLIYDAQEIHRIDWI